MSNKGRHVALDIEFWRQVYGNAPPPGTNSLVVVAIAVAQYLDKEFELDEIWRDLLLLGPSPDHLLQILLGSDRLHDRVRIQLLATLSSVDFSVLNHAHDRAEVHQIIQMVEDLKALGLAPESETIEKEW